MNRFDEGSPDTPPFSTLTELAEAAFEAEREDDRREREALARELSRPGPGADELGLERCPDCGWWRDPVPEPSRRSVEAFRHWQRRAQAHCMCTSLRCLRCGETLHPDRPAPRYFSPERRAIIHSGGFAGSLAHAQRCTGRGGPST